MTSPRPGKKSTPPKGRVKGTGASAGLVKAATAAEALAAAKTALGAAVPLAEFLERAAEEDAKRTVEERRVIVEQAPLLVEQLYVHLPLKRAMHAVDPVQRLRPLRHPPARPPPRQFHRELTG